MEEKDPKTAHARVYWATNELISKSGILKSSHNNAVALGAGYVYLTYIRLFPIITKYGGRIMVGSVFPGKFNNK
jgi:hypothetical protein